MIETYRRSARVDLKYLTSKEIGLLLSRAYLSQKSWEVNLSQKTSPSTDNRANRGVVLGRAQSGTKFRPRSLLLRLHNRFDVVAITFGSFRPAFAYSALRVAKNWVRLVTKTILLSIASGK
jgi:hypothetical protein